MAEEAEKKAKTTRKGEKRNNNSILHKEGGEKLNTWERSCNNHPVPFRIKVPHRVS